MNRTSTTKVQGTCRYTGPISIDSHPRRRVCRDQQAQNAKAITTSKPCTMCACNFSTAVWVVDVIITVQALVEYKKHELNLDNLPRHPGHVWYNLTWGCYPCTVTYCICICSSPLTHQWRSKLSHAPYVIGISHWLRLTDLTRRCLLYPTTGLLVLTINLETTNICVSDLTLMPGYRQ